MTSIFENCYEFDYAYFKQHSAEFGSATVALEVVGDEPRLFVRLCEDIELLDLELLLLGLQRNKFNLVRINIFDECKLFLDINGVVRSIRVVSYNDSTCVLELV